MLTSRNAEGAHGQRKVENPWSSSWAQGQVTWAKMARNLPHLWCHPQKAWNTKPKNFLVQTRRLAESFEGLDSSLAQSTSELWSCKLAWN